jgi:hypothetical protein
MYVDTYLKDEELIVRLFFAGKILTWWAVES